VFNEPAGSGELEVIVGKMGGLIVSENGTGPEVPTEFVAVMSIIKVPAMVGVPSRMPALESRINPGLRPVALHVMGEVPWTVNWNE
jgi:hypothetical protein